jgi:hypothetical protein
MEPKYEVYFIDFGNKEKLPSERVRTIDAALSAVPPQARPAGLAYLKVGLLRMRAAAGMLCAMLLSLLHVFRRHVQARHQPADIHAQSASGCCVTWPVPGIHAFNKTHASNEYGKHPTRIHTPHTPSCCHTQVPTLDEEFGNEAAGYLAQLLGGGKRFKATVVRKERGGGAKEKHPRKAADKLLVSMVSEDGTIDVAKEMLLAGLARLPKLHKASLRLSCFAGLLLTWQWRTMHAAWLVCCSSVRCEVCWLCT